MNVTPRGPLVAALVAVFVIAGAARAGAQQFELINSFAGCPVEGCAPDSDASVPTALVRGPDGDFYGIGDSGLTIFRQRPDGTRDILHRFDPTGPTGCGTLRISFGDDGAIYGVGRPCLWTEGTAIFRLNGTSFEILQEFPVGGFWPGWMIAGSNGAFYGGGRTGSSQVSQLFKWDGDITLFDRRVLDLQLAPDGNLYFVEMFSLPSPWDIVGGYIHRLTPTDQIQTAYVFPSSESIAPLGDLIVGDDRFLYGSTKRSVPPHGAGERRMYRFGPTDGAFTYLPGGDDLSPLAVAGDGSVFVIISGLEGATLSRLMPDGTLVTLHAFSDTGTTAAVTRGTDGHLYGVRPEGGEHGLGVFFRIRMPSVDVKANGVDGPVTVDAGDPLQISMAFDASAEIVDPAEVYLAVITPSLAVYWATATGFSATPSPLYAGPLPSFTAAPLINIPDASVLPPGAYYWVTIVDADANGVPDGHYVDFVKTTRTATTLALRRR